MDFAPGDVVESMVLALAERGEYLPLLEVLVIIDNLLDLLATAHDRQIIYNDVDAKHLFWDRDAYRLKVIDWGNAVFTDETGALPTATRGSDIFQCGELLYFILTGGNRLITESESVDTFYVNFGPDTERIPTRLQSILTHAVHRDPRRRYGTIPELRTALTEFRLPLERERNEIVSHVRRRVRSTASKEELEELAATLQTALEMDPGYPDARALQDEIDFFLNQIKVHADLDAIRIYLESGNWSRAQALLSELLPEAGPTNEQLIRFLIEATTTLETLRVSPPPAGFLAALDALFQREHATAGLVLLTTPEDRTGAQQAQWLLAEQLATLVSEVTLLRPHLVRLRHDLLRVDGANDVIALLDQVDEHLAMVPLSGVTGLQVMYQQVAALLAQFEERLDGLSGVRTQHEQEASLSTAIRGQRAAHEIVQRLDLVAHHIFENPAYAGELLQHAAAADPTSPHFDTLRDYIDEVNQAVLALGQFKPHNDGANLAAWFESVQDFLQPYLEDLSDQKLHAAAAALHQSAQNWQTVLSYLALGRRQPTIDLLAQAADEIRPFNAHIAGWCNTLAARVEEAHLVERLSPNEQLGDALINGWRAWDEGKGLQAAEFARQASELATSDGERLAVQRLQSLSDLLESWLADDGPQSVERTDQAETEALAVLLSEEEHERQTFAEQMPNTATYLRAMGRGIVAYMQQSSSAGWRALYMHYVLRGVLALLDNQFEEADFWCEVATNAYEDAQIHRAYQVLDRGLTTKRLVQKAEVAFNAVTGPDDLGDLRPTLNAPLAGQVLTGLAQAVQEINDAVRSWSDGEFHTALQALNTAQQGVQTAVDSAGLQIDSFVSWLAGLRDTAEQLHQMRLKLEQEALTTSTGVDPEIGGIHRRIVSLTLDHLGPDYAHQVRQWEDMYQAVLETYSTRRLTRREKLAAFERHFSSLFITKHPLYPLFRHWEEVTQQLPVDVVEDDVIPVEEGADRGEELPDEDHPAYLEGDGTLDKVIPQPIPKADSAGELPWNWIIAIGVILLLVAVGLGILRAAGGGSGTDDENDPAPAGAGDTSSDDMSPGDSAGADDFDEIEGSDNGQVADPPPIPSGEDDEDQPPGAVSVSEEAPDPALLPPVEAQQTAVSPTDAPPSPVPPTPRPTTAVPPTPITPTVAPTEVVSPTAVPTTAPSSPPPTPAPASTAPRNLLGDIVALPAGLRTWPTSVITPGDADGIWVISTTDAPDNTVTIELSPEILSELFQPGAASAFARVDVTFLLSDTGLVSSPLDTVTIGLGAENDDGERESAQVQIVLESGLLRYGIDRNGDFSGTEAPSGNAQEIRLSVRRGNTLTLDYFLDDSELPGTPLIVFPQGEPVTLILYVSGRDVAIEISEFDIDYDISSGDELP
ncbi:MAG: hypothetical protein GYB65_18470 [Chloroflexi bacterium]|nr:hypothetical protein [Chloroflexota bacterium]